MMRCMGWCVACCVCFCSACLAFNGPPGDDDLCAVHYWPERACSNASALSDVVGLPSGPVVLQLLIRGRMWAGVSSFDADDVRQFCYV